MLVRLDKIGGQNHLYSVISKDDLANGSFVALGGYNDFDSYNCTKLADVTKENILFVADEFLNYSGCENEADYTIKAGKRARAYQLVKGDIITITLDGITGKPKKGEFVVPVNGSYIGKAASATTNETLAFVVDELESLAGKDAAVLRVI